MLSNIINTQWELTVHRRVWAIHLGRVFLSKVSMSIKIQGSIALGDIVFLSMWRIYEDFVFLEIILQHIFLHATCEKRLFVTKDS